MTRRDDAQESPRVPAMTEDQRASYAAQLKTARVQAGMTQAEVAEQAGIARNTYAAMENGTQIPQAEKLWAAMLILGLQPSREEPEWLQEWWAVLRPLILQLPRETRGLTMGRIVALLTAAIQKGEPATGVGLQIAAKDRPGWRAEVDQ